MPKEKTEIFYMWSEEYYRPSICDVIENDLNWTPHDEWQDGETLTLEATEFKKDSIANYMPIDSFIENLEESMCEDAGMKTCQVLDYEWGDIITDKQREDLKQHIAKWFDDNKLTPVYLYKHVRNLDDVKIKLKIEDDTIRNYEVIEND